MSIVADFRTEGWRESAASVPAIDLRRLSVYADPELPAPDNTAGAIANVLGTHASRHSNCMRDGRASARQGDATGGFIRLQR
jgi:hypothetical protein